MYLILLLDIWTLWGVLVLLMYLISGKSSEITSGFALISAAVAGVVSAPVIYQAIVTSV